MEPLAPFPGKREKNREGETYMKKRLTALALACAMAIGTVALAAGAEKSITVTPMTLNINGQTVVPTKADGTAAEVFSYEGATYVPLRYLSELLGLQVEWDAANPGVAKLTGENLVLPSASYVPGTYEGSAQGFGGTVTVAVTVDANGITDVKITGDGETPAIGGAALEPLAAQIKEKGANIDSVAGASMTSDAVKKAVVTALAAAKGASAGEGTVTEVDTQVLVIGCGYAGLVAALAAAEKGAQVTVVEKRSSYGTSGHSITACNTPWQKEAGYTDSADALTKFWMDCATALGSQTAKEEMVRYAAEQSAASLEWMSAQGVDFVGCTMAPTNPFQNPFRTHVTSAFRNGRQAYMEPLYNKALEQGIQFCFDTRATELLQDETGAVVGALATSEDGATTFHANAVILATGGFANNNELIAENCPSIILRENNTGFSTGDGQLMAEAIGANMVYNGGSLCSFANPHGAAGDNLGLFMYVTEDGTRFVNENDYFLHRAAYALSKGINTYYGVFDSEMVDPSTLETAIEGGSVVKADTLEDLAKQLGMDVNTFVNTVNKYNGYCDAGEDKEFGKPAERVGYVFDPERTNDYDVDSIQQTYHLLNKIDKAPYYAVTYVASTTTITGTVGGCEINKDTQVLNTKGAAIPGLYANGEVANAQFFGMMYPQSGAALSFYLTYGRVAGQNAALYALGK